MSLSFKEIVTSENTYRGHLFFDDLDSRSLVIVWGIFMATLVSVEKYDLTSALAMLSFPLFFSTAGHYPLSKLCARVALLSPFILIVALINSFFDRTGAVAIGSIVVTSGTISGLVIVSKGIASLVAILALVHILPFHRLCSALRLLKIPEIFVTQLLLTYRFISVLSDEALLLQKARNMRSFGKKGRSIGITANLIGVLLVRTHERADRIYRAMLARGFNGQLCKTDSGKMRSVDLVFITTVSIVMIGIRTLV